MKQTILKLDNLSLKYKTNFIFDKLNLSFNKGAITFIAGPSGVGKSTLLKSIVNINSEINKLGSIKLYTKPTALNTTCYYDLLQSKDRQQCFKQHSLAFVFQEPYAHFNPNQNIYSHFKESLVVLGINKQDLINELCLSYLTQLGCNDPKSLLNSYAFELSGGLCQKTALALALISKPQCLLLDEATALLDPLSQTLVLNTLKNLVTKEQMSIIWVSHDIKLIQKAADDIYLVHNSSFIEHLNPQKLNSQNHSFASLFFNAYALKHNDLNIESSTSKNNYLSLNNISKSFKQTKTQALSVLNSISLKLYPANFYFLLGASGCGKTTLAKIIAGQEFADSGSISLNFNNNIQKLDLTKDIAYIAQDIANRISPLMSIKSFLFMTYAQTHNKTKFKLFNPKLKQDFLYEISHIFKIVDLNLDILKYKTSMISLGQLQRVLIANALLKNPKLLICDEISFALDPILKVKILNTILSLCKIKHLMVLFICHDHNLIIKGNNVHVLYMQNGEVIEKTQDVNLIE